MRVVGALTGGRPILVNTQVMRIDRDTDPIQLHATVGGRWGHARGDPRLDPTRGSAQENYRLERGADGELHPWAGFVNVGISLVEVPEGMGFACCPVRSPLSPARPPLRCHL